MITNKELKRLVEALQAGRDGMPVTQDECLTLVDWAQQAKINYAVLRGVFKGDIEVNVLDGEVVFRGDEIIRNVKTTGKKL